jgi:hypothetical protein
MGRIVAARCDRLILTTSRFRRTPAVPAVAQQLKGARAILRCSPEIVLNRRQQSGARSSRRASRMSW